MHEYPAPAVTLSCIIIIDAVHLCAYGFQTSDEIALRRIDTDPTMTQATNLTDTTNCWGSPRTAAKLGIHFGLQRSTHWATRSGFCLTGGEAHDLEGADHLLPTMEVDTLIADKAFDADERVLEPIAAAGKTAVIPPRRPSICSYR